MLLARFVIILDGNAWVLSLGAARAKPRRRPGGKVSLDNCAAVLDYESAPEWGSALAAHQAGFASKSVRESLEQGIVKLRRILDLRRVTQLGEFHECAVGEASGGFLTNARIIA